MAKAIGIGQGSLYVYFKSKEELFNEIFKLANSNKEIKDLKTLALLPIPAKKKVMILSKKIIDKLSTSEDYAAKIALNTQMMLEKNEFASNETTYQSEVYRITEKIIVQGQKENSIVDGLSIKLADYYWGVVYLYALKKLFTTQYELITETDLARVLLKNG